MPSNLYNAKGRAGKYVTAVTRPYERVSDITCLATDVHSLSFRALHLPRERKYLCGKSIHNENPLRRSHSSGVSHTRSRSRGPAPSEALRFLPPYPLASPILFPPPLLRAACELLFFLFLSSHRNATTIVTVVARAIRLLTSRVDG